MKYSTKRVTIQQISFRGVFIFWGKILRHLEATNLN